MKDKFNQFVEYCNKKGIAVPVFRDPVTQLPSVSFTLVVVSTFFVCLGLLNSIADLFKGVDMQSALYWSGMTYALYFGRKVSGNGKDIEIATNSKEG